MTVREFTGNVWYLQQIVVIKWKVFDLINNTFKVKDKSMKTIKEESVYTGTPHELRSATYDYVNDMEFHSCGVLHNTLIIEVK